MFFKNIKYLLLLLIVVPFNTLAVTKYPIDITKMSIIEINEALEKKIINSEDLVNLFLERINVYNDEYKALITINDNALQTAKELDLERKNGSIRSLLHGIPIIVKDNIDVLGMPTTAGSIYLKDNMPKQNAFVIQKLIDAGAIIIGKSNMSEFAFMASSSISSYGTVKNAYNLLYSSYGSSGGSAVSVALNFAVAALGTDTNSSVRIPAGANNVVGLRPTLGLLSRSGVLPYDIERDTIGIITKTVEDNIIILNIINGYDKNDNKSLNQDKKTFQIDDPQNYTIGIPLDFYKGNSNNILNENKETDSEIIKLMQNAIENLENIGVKIIYLDDYYTTEYNNLVMNSYSGYLFCNGFNEYIKGTTGTIRSFQELAKKSLTYSLTGYLESCGTQRSLSTKNDNKLKYRQYIENIMKKNELDVIMYPSSANKLLKLNFNGLINLSAHASSTIGFPAITIPMGFDSDCLPYGIELMGNYNDDNLLLNVASIVEKNIRYNKNCQPNAPALYEINNEVNILIENYNKMLNKNNLNFVDQKWINKVINYFENYQNAQEVKQLNKNYHLTNILSIIFVIILFIFKILFAIFITLILILIFRKLIYKKYIKRKRRKKR